MKAQVLLFTAALMFGTIAQANIAGSYLRYATLRSLTSDSGFPRAVVTVEFVRHCTESLKDIQTRQKVAQGKTWVEVGVVVEKQERPCSMHEPVWVNQTVRFEVASDLPLVLSAMQGGQQRPDDHSGATVGNFD